MCGRLRVLHGEPVGRGPLCSAASTALHQHCTSADIGRQPTRVAPARPSQAPFACLPLPQHAHIVSSVQLSAPFRAHESSHRLLCPLLPCLFWSPEFHSCASVFSRIIVVMVPAARIPIVLGPALPGSAMANTIASCCRSVAQPVPKPLYQYNSPLRKPSALCAIGRFSDL